MPTTSTFVALSQPRRRCPGDARQTHPTSVRRWSARRSRTSTLQAKTCADTPPSVPCPMHTGGGAGVRNRPGARSCLLSGDSTRQKHSPTTNRNTARRKPGPCDLKRRPSTCTTRCCDVRARSGASILPVHTLLGRRTPGTSPVEMTTEISRVEQRPSPPKLTLFGLETRGISIRTAKSRRSSKDVPCTRRPGKCRRTTASRRVRPIESRRLPQRCWRAR